MTRFVEFAEPDGTPIHVNPDQVQVVCAITEVRTPDDGELTGLAFLAGENASFILVRGEKADVLRRLESA